MQLDPSMLNHTTTLSALSLQCLSQVWIKSGPSLGQVWMHMHASATQAYIHSAGSTFKVSSNVWVLSGLVTPLSPSEKYAGDVSAKKYPLNFVKSVGRAPRFVNIPLASFLLSGE